MDDEVVYCVEVVIGSWAEAEDVAYRWDCPAPAAFADEWASYGSARFIGHDENQLAVSVLLVSGNRPGVATGLVKYDD